MWGLGWALLALLASFLPSSRLPAGEAKLWCKAWLHPKLFLLSRGSRAPAGDA